MVQVVLGMIAFVWLGMLPLQSWAQESQTEEKPLCPERPFYHPTDRDVAETGLSPEVLCIIGDTWLMRHDIPGPEESPELLRRFLRLGPYEFGKMSGAQYRAVMEEAVRLWPKSYYAHAGLARALLGGHTAPDVQPTPTELRRAADEFQIAAEIAFSKGGIPPNHIESGLVQSLTDLGDKQALDNYFKRVFELLTESRDPEGYVRDKRCSSYVDYALALAKLGDDRAETYFRKAVEISPEGVEYTYEFYLGYLLDHGKAQAALDLLTPDSKAQRVLPEDLFRNMRCQALKQLGRERECLQADGQTSPGTPSPAGSESGPSASVAPSERGLLARMLGSGLAHAAHDPNLTDDCRTHTSCCEAHPADKTGTCYHYFVWNLAEVIHNEARAEQFGSRAAVGWTIRDRVIGMSTPDGGTTTLTHSHPDPLPRAGEGTLNLAQSENA